MFVDILYKWPTCPANLGLCDYRLVKYLFYIKHVDGLIYIRRYYLFSGKRISVNSPASPGINYKTGDIIALEKSFAQFLLTIYDKL